MEFTINVKGLDKLAESIALLAQALLTAPVPISVQSPVIAQPGLPVQAAVAQPQYQPPVQQPVAPVQAQYQSSVQMQPQQAPIAPPVQQTAPVPMQSPSVIPTSHVAQCYTQDQIARAMAGLQDAGKREALLAILASFGVASLMQISPDNYPQIATKLREAGAQI
ncbi:MAG: hypothetical protein WAX04_03170 [Oscillospiraceae bacterium]